MSEKTVELKNEMFRLSVSLAPGGILLRLLDAATEFVYADGPCIFRSVYSCPEGSIEDQRILDATIDADEETLRITGSHAGLSFQQTLKLAAGAFPLEERFLLENAADHVIELKRFSTRFSRSVSDAAGRISDEVGSDRLEAIPLRHRPSDSPEFDVAFSMTDLIRTPGREQRTGCWPPAHNWPLYGHFPSGEWISEGWAWSHGPRTFGVFKFNQEFIEYSGISLYPEPGELRLLFGGVTVRPQEPETSIRLEPGQRMQPGETRYVTVNRGYENASYAFRSFLDEKGCRFPESYDPPVHWNELYDNPEWNLAAPGSPPEPRLTRPLTYTKALMETEAKKAYQYGCKALYLDPGWDTDFGTFLWGEQWLGPRKRFIEEMKDLYGLTVSLHCPLATWMSVDGRGVGSWPSEALAMGPDGKVEDGFVCLGSKPYIEEAAKRLKEHCRDGVKFLMFDGNWWSGGCWNPEHGHPVPFTMEDYMRANVELARRIHDEYPDVIIEMHDMVSGGSVIRYTPVYYKYGLPGSYDENWGFELMWDPMQDILEGRAKSLYYYNLGCNIPIYLHIDLRDDNEHCLALWWYASTCRHLGIGGTHSNPAVAEAQKRAMVLYNELQSFYKRGEFYGISEEVHVHVLPDEEAFVVNLFNLSDNARAISGEISFERMNLPIDEWYIAPNHHRGVYFDKGNASFRVSRILEPWSADIVYVRSLKAG